MSRLIDADELMEKAGRYKFAVREDIYELIDRAPTIDPVVRCKDCAWWLPPHGCDHDDGLITSLENAFCSYAERRTDE